MPTSDSPSKKSPFVVWNEAVAGIGLYRWTTEVICSGCKSAQIQFPRAGLCHMHLPVTYVFGVVFPPPNLIKKLLHNKQASRRCKVTEQSTLLLTWGSLHKRQKETKPADINHPGCQQELPMTVRAIYFAVSLPHEIQTKLENSQNPRSETSHSRALVLSAQNHRA